MDEMLRDLISEWCVEAEETLEAADRLQLDGSVYGKALQLRRCAEILEAELGRWAANQILAGPALA